MWRYLETYSDAQKVDSTPVAPFAFQVHLQDKMEPRFEHVHPYPTTTLAFYKGTHPPPLPPDVLAGVFREGIQSEIDAIEGSKKYKITVLKGLMDRWEQQICDQQAAHPEGVEKVHPCQDILTGYWGPSSKKAVLTWFRWYCVLGALLQLGGIKNDDNNGWLIHRIVETKKGSIFVTEH